MRLRNLKAGLAVLAGTFFIASGAAAQNGSERLSGSVALSSDYVFRGISQTMGRPSLQVYANAELGRGFYTYVWGSNIDFHPDSEPDDDARYEVDLAVGYATELGSHWSLDLSVVRYLYPGTIDGVDYDYNDLIATVAYNDNLAATVAFAKDVDGTNADAWFYYLERSFELPLELALDLGYGHYDLEDAYGAGYSYAHAALSRYYGDSSVTLSFNNAFGSAEDLFYKQSNGSRLFLSLEFGF